MNDEAILKTLRDLKGLDKGCANIVTQEAIKWVKDFYKRIKDEELKSKYPACHGITCGGEICIDTSFIKHFFDITEEDLK